MSKKRLKDAKDAAKYRNDLLKQQNGIDPITKEVITKPVLDHYHQGHQHCREVLQNECNAFEGKVVNSYHRMLGHITNKSLPEILRNLADYLERNGSIPEEEMVIHHTALTVDVKKFKALPAKQQCDILESFGVVPESNVKKRSSQARKLIKEGNLEMINIKKGA